MTDIVKSRGWNWEIVSGQRAEVWRNPAIGDNIRTQIATVICFLRIANMAITTDTKDSIK